MIQGSAIAPSGARAFAAVLAMLAFAGCGHSGGGAGGRAHVAVRLPVCLPAARDVIARVAGVDPAAVVAVAATGNNAEPECRFRARSARGAAVGAVANLDSSPQPYARLERTIVEDGQQFGQVRGFTPPQSVSRLGLDAAWLPDDSTLLTTDGRRLISVAVSWGRVAVRQRQALAEAVARAYLGPLQRKAGEKTEV